MQLNLLLTIILSLFVVIDGEVIETRPAIRGEMFKLQLHYRTFFPRTPYSNITWLASAVGRPTLPGWLHLAESEHRGIAYLFGIMDTQTREYNIEVIARIDDTYERNSKVYKIAVGDGKGERRVDVGSGLIRQLAHLWLKNYELYELLADNNAGRLSHLISTIGSGFGGRFSLPYIRDMKPASRHKRSVTTGTGRDSKDGTVVTIATKSSFPRSVISTAEDISNHPEQCHAKSHLYPLNKQFLPDYQVDWCKLRVVTVDPRNKRATIKYGGLMSSEMGVDAYTYSDFGVHNKTILIDEPGVQQPKFEPYTKKELRREYFADWIMVLPIPGVILVFLLLVLSLIFFGHREGQRWRDYKTPGEQLREYVSLRRGQHKLRDLSVQRQSFARADESGIRAFLVPKDGRRMVPVAQDAPPPYTGSVGKQTVAEAAAVRGNSLEPYIDPAANDDDMNTRPKPSNESDQDTLVAPEELSNAPPGSNLRPSRSGGGLDPITDETPTPPMRRSRVAKQTSNASGTAI